MPSGTKDVSTAMDAARRQAQRRRRRAGPLSGSVHRLFLEEHHRRIGVQHFAHPLRIALRPGADVLHGRLVREAQLALVHQASGPMET